MPFCDLSCKAQMSFNLAANTRQSTATAVVPACGDGQACTAGAHRNRGANERQGRPARGASSPRAPQYHISMALRRLPLMVAAWHAS